MPDERTPGATPAASPAAPAASPTATPPAPGPVPYERFKEKVDEANTFKQEKARLEGQLQQAQQVVQQAQQIIQQQQQRPAPPASAPAAPVGDDPWESILTEGLGNDDAGKEARRLMDIHAEQMARKKGFITKDEAIHIARQIAEQGNNKIATAFQVTNNFQAWVQKGVITAEEAQGLQGELNQHLARNPDLSSQPHNVMYLAKGLLADAVTEGRVRPYSQPAPTNPLQPSGAPSAPAPGEALPPIDPQSLGFRTLRSLSADKIKALTAKSNRAHQGATS